MSNDIINGSLVFRLDGRNTDSNAYLTDTVNGTVQTLYANDMELITLTDCNTVGFANQNANITDPVGFEFMKK